MFVIKRIVENENDIIVSEEESYDTLHEALSAFSKARKADRAMYRSIAGKTNFKGFCDNAYNDIYYFFTIDKVTVHAEILGVEEVANEIYGKI